MIRKFDWIGLLEVLYMTEHNLSLRIAIKQYVLTTKMRCILIEHRAALDLESFAVNIASTKVLQL